MTDTILDQGLVGELVEVMGEGFTNLVDSFRSDSMERVKGLQLACQDDDAEQLRLLSHSFKGSSSNLGAVKVAATCKQIEDLARQDQVAEAGALMAQLQSELNEALAALEGVA